MILLAHTNTNKTDRRTLFLSTACGTWCTGTACGHGHEVDIKVQKETASVESQVEIRFGDDFTMRLTSKEAAWFVAHLGDALIKSGGMNGPLRTTPQGMPCNNCGEFTPYTERRGLNCGIATPTGGVDVSGHCTACVKRKRIAANKA